MPPPLRLDEPWSWQHVMSRGAAPAGALPAAGDHAALVRLLAEARARLRVEIHAYCLMGSHYHLLLRGSDTDLLELGRRIDATLSAAPAGRRHALPIDAVRHLAYVSRYIHLNPVPAALAIRAEDWPFSSYRGYVDPSRAPGWLSTQVVLGWFGGIGARQRYRWFVEQGLDPGAADFYGRRRLGGAADEFHEELARRRALELPPYRPPAAGGPPPTGHRPPLSVIAIAVAEAFGVAGHELTPRRSDAHPVRSLARGALVHAARRLGGYTLPQIAAWLGYASYGATARAALRFAARARAERDVERLLERLIEEATERWAAQT